MISHAETPITNKACLESLDDTGCVTRMEPIYEAMEMMERRLVSVTAERDDYRKALVTLAGWFRNSRGTPSRIVRDVLAKYKETP